MQFEFIDNSTAIDRASRRQIRSHVAKGRNAGRKLNRPSRRSRNSQALRRTARAQLDIQETAPVLAQPHTGVSTSSLTQRALTCLPTHWQQDAASGGIALISRGEHVARPQSCLPDILAGNNLTRTSSSHFFLRRDPAPR
jgi:hypothetical protein